MIPLFLDLGKSRRTLLFGICFALLFTSIGYLAIYPSFEDQLQGIAEDMPDAYKAFIGDADLTSPEGYVRSQVYSLVAPLLIAGLTITAGASLARAERDQTLVVLATSPLSRSQLAGAWWLYVGALGLVGGLMTVIGVFIGGPLAGAEISFGAVILATLPMLMFGVLVGTVTLFASAQTGAPGTASAIGWVAVLVSFLANSLAELIESLSWLSNVNPWSWHGAGEAVTGDFDLSGFLLLVLATAVVGVLAIARFARRDLHL